MADELDPREFLVQNKILKVDRTEALKKDILEWAEVYGLEHDLRFFTFEEWKNIGGRFGERTVLNIRLLSGTAIDVFEGEYGRGIVEKFDELVKANHFHYVRGTSSSIHFYPD